MNPRLEEYSANMRRKLLRHSAEQLRTTISTISSHIPAESVPATLLTVEFAVAYSTYHFYRKITYNEVLHEKTIQAQLAWLADEPDSIAPILFALDNGNKSLRPIDPWARQQYRLHKPAERYAIRVHRADRTIGRSTIHDTVYAPRTELGIDQSEEIFLERSAKSSVASD